MSNKLLLVIFSCGLIISVGCKSKKGIQKGSDILTENPAINSKVILLNNINASQNFFTYYSASGEMNFKDDNTKQELGVSIVMEKDQYVLFNITAILGITVARILATPDSVVILDMLHRKAYIASYDFVQKTTGANLRLSNIQNMLVGNTLFATSAEKSTVDSLLNEIDISQTIAPGVLQKTVYSLPLKVKQSSITQQAQKQEMLIAYKDFFMQASNRFPAVFDINIRAEKNMETQFELKNFVFEKKKELQFSIPKSYEKIRL